MILRKRELRFLLGSKERAVFLRPNSQTPAPLQPLGPPTPLATPPPATTHLSKPKEPPTWVLLAPPTIFLLESPIKAGPTSSGSSHLSSPALSCYNSPIREGRSSPDSVQSGSSLVNPHSRLVQAKPTNRNRTLSWPHLPLPAPPTCKGRMISVGPALPGVLIRDRNPFS